MAFPRAHGRALPAPVPPCWMRSPASEAGALIYAQTRWWNGPSSWTTRRRLDAAALRRSSVGRRPCSPTAGVVMPTVPTNDGYGLISIPPGSSSMTADSGSELPSNAQTSMTGCADAISTSPGSASRTGCLTTGIPCFRTGSELKGFSIGWSTPAIMSSYRVTVTARDDDRELFPRTRPKDAWLGEFTDRPLGRIKWPLTTSARTF